MCNQDVPKGHEGLVALPSFAIQATVTFKDAENVENNKDGLKCRTTEPICRQGLELPVVGKDSDRQHGKCRSPCTKRPPCGGLRFHGGRRGT